MSAPAFRLSCISDEATQDFYQAVELAHRAGLSGLELRSVEDMPVDLIPANKLRQWHSVLCAEGLSVPCLASRFFKCGVEARAPESERLRRLCGAAEILEAPLIRGFAFLGAAQVPMRAEELAEYFEEPAAILRRHGMRMVLESDPGVTTTNCASLAALLSRLDPALFGAVYDPGNDLYDPCGESPYPEGYEALAGRILHVHVKDAVREEGGARCVPLGKGSVKWRMILRALSRDGWSGWLSLEPHYRSGAQLTREQMLLPAGSSFSSGGVEALLESAAGLHRLVDSMEGSDICAS